MRKIILLLVLFLSLNEYLLSQTVKGKQSYCPGLPTITYAGKTYNTVEIGNQCWLKENMNVGTMIKSYKEGYQQKDNGKIEKYCYDNKPANCDKYGGLYEWPEAMQYANEEGARGICPEGWHIPTKTELKALVKGAWKEEIWGEKNENGNSLKEVGQGKGDGAGRNTSGFSALLAGYRNHLDNFSILGDYSGFWSSTELYSDNAYYLSLSYFDSNIYLSSHLQGNGFSVRCVKDN